MIAALSGRAFITRDFKAGGKVMGAGRGLTHDGVGAQIQ